VVGGDRQATGELREAFGHFIPTLGLPGRGSR
jgi:hypothetical protein